MRLMIVWIGKCDIVEVRMLDCGSGESMRRKKSYEVGGDEAVGFGELES
jgi:hypothetical protein